MGLRRLVLHSEVLSLQRLLAIMCIYLLARSINGRLSEFLQDKRGQDGKGMIALNREHFTCLRSCVSVDVL